MKKWIRNDFLYNKTINFINIILLIKKKGEIFDIIKIKFSIIFLFIYFLIISKI